jgi:predicted helicase
MLCWKQMNGSELTAVFNLYIDKLQREYNTQRATEQSYRPALKALIESLDPSIIAVNESKRLAVGAPDLVIERQESHILRQAKLFSSPPLALVEAKDFHIDLDSKENQEQLNRYLEMGNVLHTNHLEFRFYVNHKLVTTIHLAEVLQDQRIMPDSAQYDAFYVVFRQLLRAAPTIRTPKMLADLMAQRARAIKEYIQKALVKDLGENNDSELREQFEVFKNQLVHGLNVSEFADLYAQTLAYGLFAARYQDETLKDFSLKEAAEILPATNPFLQRFFREIAGYEKEERINWVLDSLVDVFLHCDVRQLMLGAGEEWTRRHDPIIHFYETFLDEYDPQLRRQMGVYYTPIPIVQYIVRFVDEVLKGEFNISDGLADTEKIEVAIKSHARTKSDIKRGYAEGKRSVHRVQVLDPAIGTGTFLNEVIKHVFGTVKPKLGSGWSKYVELDLLPRLYGFELLMAPYAMAHLRLNLTLAESKYKPILGNERLRVYLTNTLEEPHLEDDELPNLLGFQRILATEAQEADVVKTNAPVMVVLGNPPYAGISSNETDFANKLVKTYKIEPGGIQKLQERKHWLNDDYVKFLAFSEAMINKTGEGIVAMITNHGYLDNSTFRGMRWHLLKSFSKIYILDLHGNAKRKERTPKGGKDENVFNIQQGVSIIVAIKKPKLDDDLAEVYRADLWGKQSEKFRALDSGKIAWQPIKPSPKLYSFVIRKSFNEEAYQKGIAVNELFPQNVTGIVTARDQVVIDLNKKQLLERIKRFSDPSFSDEEIRDWLFSNRKAGKYPRGDSRGWELPLARKRVAEQNVEEYIQPILYRPFDMRWIYYHPDMVDWGRFKFTEKTFQGPNIGLVVSRLNRQMSLGYEFMSENLTDFHVLDTAGDSTSLMPLYIYDSTLLAENNLPIPNWNENLVKALLPPSLASNLVSHHSLKQADDQEKVSPLDILNYVYAVLHSTKYREEYKEFIKTDFPRIPAAKTTQGFWRMSKYGDKLRELHIMKSSILNEGRFTPSGEGDWIIKKVQFEATDKDNGKVWINKTQYFSNIPKVVWEFYVGGYRPAYKWLNDRRDQELKSDDLRYYQRIVTALGETEKIMKKIDRER